MTNRNKRGSVLMLAGTMIALLMIVSMGAVWIVGTEHARRNEERAGLTRQTSESTLLSIVVMQTRIAMDTVLATHAAGGTTNLPASEVEEMIEANTKDLIQGMNISNWPFPPESIQVTYVGLPTNSPGSPAGNFSATGTLALTAKPFILLEAPEGLAEPFHYIDYVPEKHPLAGMQVRRFPFLVRYSYTQGGQTHTMTRRISVYHVAIAQFARFSSGNLDTTDPENMGQAESVYAFGNVKDVNDTLGTSVSRLWASQTGTVDVLVDTTRPVTVDEAYNLGPVQTSRSRLGGRIAGEQWLLIPPHFFSGRPAGEKIVGTSRPVPLPGDPLARAYDANTYLEMIYHPSRVTAADLTVGICTVNRYDMSGTIVNTWEGRMRGQNAGEQSPFTETIFSSEGSVVSTRDSTTSVSAAFTDAGATRSRASFDYVALDPGNALFRISNPSGDQVTMTIDGTVVFATFQTSAVATVNLGTGPHNIQLDHATGAGNVSVFVTPPGLPEAYVSQWSVASNTNPKSYGSLNNAPSFLSWRPLPNGMYSNQTGQSAGSLILKLDEPWPFTAATEDVTVYAEGIQENASSRYFTSDNRTFSNVIIELQGDTLHTDITSRPSFSVLSANPVVVEGRALQGNYHGFYIVARGTEGEDSNSLYQGYDQANLLNLNLTGVLGGQTLQMPSYFDRVAPSATAMTARPAQASETNTFFKTLALIDDYIYSQN